MTRSLSNLYKPRLIANFSEDACIINSNALVFQKIEEQAKVILPRQLASDQGETAETEAGDGFVAGLTGEPIDVEALDHPVDPAEEVEQAREEAEQILAEANEKSKEILARAQEEAAQLKQEARQTGREQGYEEGIEQAKQEYDRKEQQLAQREQELSEDYARKQEELEPLLVQTITDVIEKVFRIQFHDKKEIVLDLVNRTLASIDGARSFLIKTNIENARFLEEHKQELSDCVGSAAQLDIVSDHTLADGACVIETDTGVFECGPDTQLENLMKDLRSLCS